MFAHSLSPQALIWAPQRTGFPTSYLFILQQNSTETEQYHARSVFLGPLDI